jgi:hypothetical protein
MRQGQRGGNFGSDCHFDSRSGSAALQVMHHFENIKNEAV